MSAEGMSIPVIGVYERVGAFVAQPSREPHPAAAANPRKASGRAKRTARVLTRIPLVVQPPDNASRNARRARAARDLIVPRGKFSFAAISGYDSPEKNDSSSVARCM